MFGLVTIKKIFKKKITVRHEICAGSNFREFRRFYIDPRKNKLPLKIIRENLLHVFRLLNFSLINSDELTEKRVLGPSSLQSWHNE